MPSMTGVFVLHQHSKAPSASILQAMVVIVATTGASVALAQPVTEPSLKGYGIKAVDGETLANMRDRCARAALGEAKLMEGETPALLKARCDQLARSMHNQPGNTRRAKR